MNPAPPSPKGIDPDRWRMIVMPLVELLRTMTPVELQWLKRDGLAALQRATPVVDVMQDGKAA